MTRTRKPRLYKTPYTREQLIEIGLAFDARIAGLRQGLVAATQDAADRIRAAALKVDAAEQRVRELEAEIARLKAKRRKRR